MRSNKHSAPADIATDIPLRIGTFNTLYTKYYETHCKAGHRFTDKERAKDERLPSCLQRMTLLALQEFPRDSGVIRDYVVRCLPRHTLLLFQGGSHEEGPNIAYDASVLEAAQPTYAEFPKKKPSDATNALVAAVFTVKRAQPPFKFVMFSCHLPYLTDEPSYTAALEVIRTAASRLSNNGQLPLIVAGDFNQSDAGTALERPFTTYFPRNEWVDWLSGHTLPTVRLPGNDARERIDYVLYRDGGGARRGLTLLSPWRRYPEDDRRLLPHAANGRVQGCPFLSDHALCWVDVRVEDVAAGDTGSSASQQHQPVDNRNNSRVSAAASSFVSSPHHHNGPADSNRPQPTTNVGIAPLRANMRIGTLNVLHTPHYMHFGKGTIYSEWERTADNELWTRLDEMAVLALQEFSAYGTLHNEFKRSLPNHEILSQPRYDEGPAVAYDNRRFVLRQPPPFVPCPASGKSPRKKGFQLAVLESKTNRKAGLVVVSCHLEYGAYEAFYFESALGQMRCAVDDAAPEGWPVVIAGAINCDATSEEYKAAVRMWLPNERWTDALASLDWTARSPHEQFTRIDVLFVRQGEGAENLSLKPGSPQRLPGNKYRLLTHQEGAVVAHPPFISDHALCFVDTN